MQATGYSAWDEQYQIAISKSPEAVSAKMDRLQGRVTELEQYKQEHEAGEYPELSVDQQKQWAAAFAPYSGKIGEFDILHADSRSELFIDSIKKALAVDGLYPYVQLENVPDGVAINSDSQDLTATVKTLFLGLPNQIRVAFTSTTDPKLKLQLGNRSLLQIELGHRLVQTSGNSN